MTRPAPSAKGLTAHWSFDDCSAADLSGNGYGGVLHGKSTCVEGRSAEGRALQFSKSDSSYVLVAQDIKLGGDYTLSAWVRYNTQKRGWQIVASRMLNAETDQEDAWDLALNFERLFFFHSGGHNHTEYCCLAHETWQMLTVTVTGKTGTVYVDGNPVHSFEAMPFEAQDDLPICIGCNDFNTLPPVHYFEGAIDDLRIYGRALDPIEVKALWGGD